MIGSYSEIVSRKYRSWDGNYRIISIPEAYWEMYDWIQQEYYYPAEDFIELVEDADPPCLFNDGFRRLVKFTYWDLLSDFKGLANDNWPKLGVVCDVDLGAAFGLSVAPAIPEDVRL